MLRDLLYLEAIAIAIAVPVFQPATKYENIKVLEVQPTVGSTTFRFLLTEQPISESNDINFGVTLEEQANQRTNSTATSTQTTMLSNTTETLDTRYTIIAKKKAKNSFPFYAYILFALVPIFTVFILLR